MDDQDQKEVGDYPTNQGTASSSLPTINQQQSPQSNSKSGTEFVYLSTADIKAIQDSSYEKAKRDMRIEKLEKQVQNYEKDLSNLKWIIKTIKVIKGFFQKNK